MSILLKNTLSPLKGVVTAIVLLTLLLWSARAQKPPGQLLLQVSHARSGAVFFVHPVRAEDEIRFSWIHSVELTPWEEYYKILNGGDLLLIKTRFQSYGAGVPEYGGTFRKEREWMVHENINSVLPALQWIHSQTAEFHLELNNSVLLKSTDLPHHEPLKLSIIRDTR